MPGPIHGIKVLELAQIMAGPTCGLLLAKMDNEKDRINTLKSQVQQAALAADLETLKVIEKYMSREEMLAQCPEIVEYVLALLRRLPRPVCVFVVVVTSLFFVTANKQPYYYPNDDKNYHQNDDHCCLFHFTSLLVVS